MRTQNTAGSSLFAFIAILYLVLLFGPSCQSKSTQSREPPLKIAAFNVQVYGESKYGDTEVVTVLKKVGCFGLLLVLWGSFMTQEIPVY